jgi:hypothetical protein
MKMKFVLFACISTFCIQANATSCYKQNSDGTQCEQQDVNGSCDSENAYVSMSACNSHRNDQSGNSQGGNRQGGNAQQNGNTAGSRCQSMLDTERKTWRVAADAYTANNLAIAPLTAATKNLSETDLQNCRALEVMSGVLSSPGLTSQESMRTIDGRASCIKKGGYTADYESCKSTAGAYNAILMLEKVMLAEQSQRSQSNQQNLQAKASAQLASGDGQNAAFDATIADTQFKKGLDEEQFAAYSSAVAFLGAKLASWQKGSEDALKGLCKKKDPLKSNPNVVPTKTAADALIAGGKPIGLPDKTLLPALVDCEDAVKKANDYARTEIIANNTAKSAFALALTEFFSKAAQAKIAADRLKAISQAVAAAKASTATGANGAPGFVNCAATPKAPSCIKIGDRVNANGISQGNFSAGEGFGNNSFDTGATTAGSTGTEVAGTGPSANVGNMTSPFNDQAKAANQILDPAKAASITPTGGSGGGGGGVGGGLGGGGVSLGNDLSGADKNGNKTKDIEANKLSGSYSGAGGKGFSALAANKEDNPFASLFDSKSQGGLEEDRSIASDSGGTDSGIFQKISRRYEQVQSDKRIEANNLE